MNVFMSYCTEEKEVAEDIVEYLRRVFRSDDLKVFISSSRDSIDIGDEWQEKIIKELKKADALLVLMSWRALNNLWVNFEIGIAWAREARILMFCHKGLSEGDLPSPYRSLQVESLTGLDDIERNQKVAKVVERTLGIKITPREVGADLPVTEKKQRSFFQTYRTWSLRPLGHVGETAEDRFLVGVVRQADYDKAKAAGLEPGEALYVRLFLSEGREGGYVNAMVGGELAGSFELVYKGETTIEAKVRLAGAIVEEDRTIPLLVIDGYKKIK